MAYCHGADSPYGCGHHKEHQRAARKGWTTRRRSRSFLATRDADDLKRVVGPSLEGHHVHRTKTGARRHMLKIEGQWFSMGQDEYKRMVRAGREGRQAEVREAREEKRRPRREAAYRAAQERQARAVERAELKEVRHIITKAGGIRPSVTHSGVRHETSEYRRLPSSMRRAHGRLTVDQAREAVDQHMPWLHLDTTDDFYQYFERVEDRHYARMTA